MVSGNPLYKKMSFRGRTQAINLKLYILKVVASTGIKTITISRRGLCPGVEKFLRKELSPSLILYTFK